MLPVEAYDAGLRWVDSFGRRVSRLVAPGRRCAPDPRWPSSWHPPPQPRSPEPHGRNESQPSVRSSSADVGVDADLVAAVGLLDDQLQPPLTSAEALHDLRASGRAQTLTAIASVVILAGVLMAGTTYGLSRLLGQGGIITEVTTSPPEPGGEGNEPGRAETRRLVWDEAGSPIGFTNGSSVDDGKVYLLSTAPRGSIDSFQPALWATTDGATWSQQVLRTSFSDGFTVFGGRMYILSTAPDSRIEAPSFQLSMTGLDDGSETVLGLDIAPDFGIDMTKAEHLLAIRRRRRRARGRPEHIA